MQSVLNVLRRGKTHNSLRLFVLEEQDAEFIRRKRGCNYISEYELLIRGNNHYSVRLNRRRLKELCASHNDPLITLIIHAFQALLTCIRWSYTSWHNKDRKSQEYGKT